ncbi:uncharacterized protein H6S33_003677 [Morchella sextelata]|uniref:uncharacterized protein n=1 Tax=Morchella sextelata TaxID=1174677 RepID=UPI001D04D3FD|nr:uncharacterized protein H6S33_003677 [Morchella sextelata]KAH0606843.1 hypothetical protein H6S33_003677 [Morchella sextelata]
METNLSDTLNSIFDPLLRIDKKRETVHLIHQSAKDFLTDSRLMKKCHDLLISPAESNLQIATTFQIYLSLDEFEDLRIEWPEYGSRPKYITDKDMHVRLLDYIEYWPDHVNEAKAEDPGLWESFSRLAISKRKINLAFEIYRGSKRWSLSRHIQALPLLNISAALGLEFYLRRLLDEGTE